MAALRGIPSTIDAILKADLRPGIKVTFGYPLALVATCVFAATVAIPAKAGAEYLYLTNNARLTHERLIKDIQGGSIDTRNLSPEAQRSVKDMAQAIGDLTAGKLIKICQTLELEYPGGRHFAFDTHHDNTMISWVVQVSQSPEQVLHLTSWPLPPDKKPGPPAILPMPTAETRVLPPVELGCGPLVIRPPSEKEREICQKYPKIC